MYMFDISRKVVCDHCVEDFKIQGNNDYQIVENEKIDIIALPILCIYPYDKSFVDGSRNL